MAQVNKPQTIQAGSEIFEVQIAGISLKLKSEKNRGEVQKLVSFVDKRINEALSATKNGSVQNAALLALLNLAEELFELKQTALMKLEKVEKKTLKIIDELESSTKVVPKAEKNAAQPLDN